MSPLPAFLADTTSPKLPAEGAAITIVTSGDGPMNDVVVHGSYRVTEAMRARLGPAAIRHQLWLVAIHRGSRVAYRGKVAGDAIVFGEDEPEKGPVSGWFHCALMPTVKMPEKAVGPYDLIAVLGPLRSAPVGVTVRRSSSSPAGR